MELSKKPGARSAGFSLLEVVVVVVIIGTLAAIAIPMFQSYQLRSKSAEAETNLGAITVAARAYFAENGAFVNANPEPAAIPGTQAVPFDSIGSDFATIGFAPEGSVYFSYGIAASADGTGYTADAGADIDGNGIVQFRGFAKPDSAGAVVAGQVGCNAAALIPLEVGPCDPAVGRTVF